MLALIFLQLPLVCLFCSLILTLQLAQIRKAPYPQGIETSAWHPKNAIAGSLQPTAVQGLLLNYSWLCSGLEEINFQSTVAPLKSLGTKEGNAKQAEYRNGQTSKLTKGINIAGSRQRSVFFDVNPIRGLN